MRSLDEVSEVRLILKNSKSGNASAINDENEYSSRRTLIEMRAESITKSLKSLTEQQIGRYKFRRWLQIVISAFFMLLVSALTVAIIVCITFVLKNKDINYINAIAVIVGSAVTYLTSVITIVAIIVKYAFPENEDKLLAELISKVIEEEQTLLNEELTEEMNKGQNSANIATQTTESVKTKKSTKPTKTTKKK